MTTLRSLVLSSALLAACTADAPAEPKTNTKAAPVEATPARPPGTLPSKRLPPGDPHAEPLPGEEPREMAVVPGATGTFDLTRDGKVVHFARLPRGQNRAVLLPDGTGRVSLGASETDEGLPHVRILIEGLRLDQAKYPVTIDGKAAAEGKGPKLTMRYEVNDNRIYVIDPPKGAEMQLTLEAFEGTTLRGKFDGKLAPTAAGLGGPVPFSGKFTIELGLQGIEPAPAPAPQPGL